ncbi:LOW QUALITY PROTEIN: hypothetical protein CFC21_105720 [Triticum aestivum]|uniref:Acetyltransferase n=2 Tax=Triticum aestivum TaxID=4565 RepID=A0A3B6SPI6_WHEAT|nr:LOW QUALITY PROTEIN: hypothetical protein CFC21_105720 [Triticum aestivum]
MVLPEPVKSLPPERETTIDLTTWDLSMISLEYNQKGILLPKPPTTAGQGHHAVVERLASSLARALGRFYPYAGRLAVTPGSNAGGESIVISLCCSMEGAEFVHAVAPGVTVADVISTPLRLRTPGVQVRSFFSLDGLHGVDAAVGSHPLLAAQVTELADGFFVAMSLSHVVADGTAFWHLFNTWSEISRRGCDGAISSPLPVHRRWFLDGCPVPVPLPFSRQEDIPVNRRTDEHPSSVKEECFLNFPAEMIKKLKAKANAEMPGTSISSLQALLAHLWIAVCRARRLAPDQRTAYVLAVGCRGRVDGLPAAYAGNAVARVEAVSTAGEILERGLGWAASLLNRAVASFDVASERGRHASWRQRPSFLRVPSRPTATAMMVGGSPWFDAYGNDFGWGRPVGVQSGPANKMDGTATAFEGRSGGGSMALEVCLPPEVLARLVADEEFMRHTAQ